MEWKYEAGSPEPLIYATWVETFIKMLLEDELSFNSSYANMASPLFLEKVLRNYKNAEAWCDIKHSDKIETCVELSKSLTKSLRKLKDLYGSDINNWRWGDEEELIILLFQLMAF